MRREFKLGDLVRVKKCRLHTDCNYVGLISRISCIYDNMLGASFPYSLEGCDEMFSASELELVNPSFNKKDLKERYIVVFKNGMESMFDGSGFREIREGKFMRHRFVHIDDFDDYLNNKVNADFSIVKICKPRYDCIWMKSEDEIREVTMAEVEERFGCKVRIKKEEN